MSVDLLHRAAADMRALAEAATPGPWWAAVGQGPKRRKQQTALVGRADMRGQGEAGCIAVLAGLNQRRADDAEHIASWHPAVALAVADWLDKAAADLAQALDELSFLGKPGPPTPGSATHAALAVATAYLGAPS